MLHGSIGSPGFNGVFPRDMKTTFNHKPIAPWARYGFCVLQGSERLDMRALSGRTKD